MDKDALLTWINGWRDWLNAQDIDEDWGEGHEAFEEALLQLKKQIGA